MSDLSKFQSGLRTSMKSRSMGVKLLVVCGLALLMNIPALFVGSLVEDRTARAGDVTKEISSHVGGQQTFLGPTLAIPYVIPPQSVTQTAKHGIYLVFPTRASSVVKTATEERHRSLFKVPVFQADVKFDAAFDLTGVPAAAPKDAELDWSHAEIVVGVSNVRGALADAMLMAGGRTVTLVPAEIAENLSIGGDQSQHINLALLGARAEVFAKPNAQFDVTSALRFSGAQRVAVLAYGKTTHLAVQGNWPSPGFDGGFLPITRTVSTNGFSAEWSVPFVARSVRAEGPSDSITGLDATALGVSFIEVADPYQSVNRSLKYADSLFGINLSLLLRVRGYDRQACSPGAICSGRNRTDHLLPAALVSCRKNRLRLWISLCGCGDGGAAFGRCRLGILQPIAGSTCFGHFHLAVCIDLSAAAT